MRIKQSIFTAHQCLHFGLDISPVALKLVHLIRRENHDEVGYLGYYPLAEHIIVGNKVEDISGLTHAIKSLLVELDLWSKTNLLLHAVIAVPDACTIQKNVQISERLSEDELEDLVTLELARGMSDALTDLYYDYQSYAKGDTTSVKNLHIVAARAQHVKDRVEALRQIGITVTVVDVESFAVQRILPFILSQDQTDGISALLDLNHHVIKIYFFQQTTVLFTHEEILDKNVLPTSENTEAYQAAVLQRFKRACHFFYIQFPSSLAVTQILLAGEGTKLPTFFLWLQQQYAAKVQILDPFNHMHIAESCNKSTLERHAPFYLIACGLAKRVS